MHISMAPPPLPAAPPDIELPPLPQTVPVHSILNLTCEASGLPRPSILWLLNDSLVSVSNAMLLL